MIVGGKQAVEDRYAGTRIESRRKRVAEKRGAWKGMGEKEGEAGGEETKDKKGRSKDNLERRK